MCIVCVRISFLVFFVFFFFQAEDGIRDLVRSRGLGDVYKRQVYRQAGGNGDYDNRDKNLNRACGQGHP